MTARILGEKIGHQQAQELPPRDPGVDPAVAAITGVLAAGEPSGVLPAGSGRHLRYL